MIIHDDNPTTEMRQSNSPPMMSVVAVDQQGSRVFELDTELRGLHLKARDDCDVQDNGGP